MSRFTFKLGFVLFAILLGIAIVVLLSVDRTRSAAITQISVPPLAELKVQLNHRLGWEKIEADGKFSFYLQPDLKEVELIGCPFGIRKYFGNQSLAVGYDYIPHGATQYGSRGKSFCELMEKSLADQEMFQSSEVEIGGRRARQIFWQVGDPKHSQMMLCFPDLGDGTVLKFGAHLEDESAMYVAKEILGSIEFR